MATTAKRWVIWKNDLGQGIESGPYVEPEQQGLSGAEWAKAAKVEVAPVSELEEVERERDALLTGKLPSDHPLIRAQDAEAKAEQAEQQAASMRDALKWIAADTADCASSDPAAIVDTVHGIAMSTLSELPKSYKVGLNTFTSQPPIDVEEARQVKAGGLIAVMQDVARRTVDDWARDELEGAVKASLAPKTPPAQRSSGSIEAELAAYPEVRWDRFIEYGGMVRVYGWLDRDDGRADFLLLDFDAATGELHEWTTSAHPHPASVVERLESEASVECQRVEDHFEIPNAVRLPAPQQHVEQARHVQDLPQARLESRRSRTRILHHSRPGTQEPPSTERRFTMTQPGDRLRIKETLPTSQPLPSDFEGTFVTETSGEDGTWLELKDCSPGAPQRLVLRENCEAVELVRDE